MKYIVITGGVVSGLGKGITIRYSIFELQTISRSAIALTNIDSKFPSSLSIASSSASSVGRILKASGVRITSIKIDPYLNVDAGTYTCNISLFLNALI